jgi:mono/diheme cytochrome c family protein
MLARWISAITFGNLIGKVDVLRRQLTEALIRHLLWIAAFACCGMQTFAQEPGDIAAGRRLAQQWCSECHLIDSEAPSFVEVANEPSTTPLSLRVFLRSNHKNMPNLHISLSEADDLVAYILSLKKK